MGVGPHSAPAGTTLTIDIGSQRSWMGASSKFGQGNARTIARVAARSGWAERYVPPCVGRGRRNSERYRLGRPIPVMFNVLRWHTMADGLEWLPDEGVVLTKADLERIFVRPPRADQRHR